MSNSNSKPVFLPLGVSRKKDTGSGFKRPPKLTRPVPSSVRKDGSSAELKPGHNNRLLAGYMANELLTEGTLFGQEFNPAGPSSAAAKPIQPKKHQSYIDMANLVKSDRSHIPGVVNPTHLAQWLQQM